MDDSDILDRIRDLVGKKHQIRDSHGDAAEIRRVEEALDQCWDLLRQRRARREFDSDPDQAVARPTGQVEGYLQ